METENSINLKEFLTEILKYLRRKNEEKRLHLEF